MVLTKPNGGFRDCARELGRLLVELLLESGRDGYRDRRQRVLLPVVYTEEVRASSFVS